MSLLRVHTAHKPPLLDICSQSLVSRVITILSTQGKYLTFNNTDITDAIINIILRCTYEKYFMILLGVAKKQKRQYFEVF